MRELTGQTRFCRDQFKVWFLLLLILGWQAYSAGARPDPFMFEAFTGKPVALGDFVKSDPPQMAGHTTSDTSRLAVIVACISETFGVSARAMCSADTRGPIMLARRVCMSLIREQIYITYDEIAELFNRRAGCSAFQAADAIRYLRQTDPRFAQKYAALVAEIETRVAASAAAKPASDHA